MATTQDIYDHEIVIPRWLSITELKKHKLIDTCNRCDRLYHVIYDLQSVCVRCEEIHESTDKQYDRDPLYSGIVMKCDKNGKICKYDPHVKCCDVWVKIFQSDDNRPGDIIVKCNKCNNYYCETQNSKTCPVCNKCSGMFMGICMIHNYYPSLSNECDCGESCGVINFDNFSNLQHIIEKYGKKHNLEKINKIKVCVKCVGKLIKRFHTIADYAFNLNCARLSDTCDSYSNADNEIAYGFIKRRHTLVKKDILHLEIQCDIVNSALKKYPQKAVFNISRCCYAKISNDAYCLEDTESQEHKYCENHEYLSEYNLKQLTHCQICPYCGLWCSIDDHDCAPKVGDSDNDLDSNSEPDDSDNDLDSNNELNNKPDSDNDSDGESASESKTTVVKKYPACFACVQNNCKVIKRGINEYDNGKTYCNLHNEKYSWFDDLALRNKKPCKEHNRKCKNELDINDTNDRCEDCKNKLLQKSREYEVKRTLQKATARSTNDTCWKCRKTYDDPNEFLDANGAKTKKCKSCRAKFAAYDRQARANGTRKRSPMSESTLQKKKEWKIANHDKIAGYWLKYRAKKIAEMGEKYWENNAIRAKQMRQTMTQEEKWLFNDGKRRSIENKLKYYKDRAKRSNISWELTDEEAVDMFNDVCNYCNCEPDEYYNGIDRVDNDIGYIKTNTVTACRMCNIMKACLDADIFLKRCEHILTYLGLIQGNQYADIFPKTVSSTYSMYKNRAIQKEIEFDITEQEFNEIVIQDCYLCGTPSYNNHINGIDRFDSGKGYVLENSRSCCTECNYMKNNYNYNDFVNKLKNIYNENKTVLELNNIIDEPNLYNFIEKKSGTFNIANGELNLYRFSKTTQKFHRTNVCFENLDNGEWHYAHSSKNVFFEIFSNMSNEEDLNVSTDTFVIDSDIHAINYITLSQSHNKEIEHKKLPDQLNMIIKTHDSSLIADVPKNRRKITVNVTRFNEKIIKIQFECDQEKIDFCDCDTCESHDQYCHCSSCMNCYLHGVGEVCVWCTENKITIKPKKLIKTMKCDYKIVANKRIFDRYTVDSYDDKTIMIKNIYIKKRRYKDALYQKNKAIQNKSNCDDEELELQKNKNKEYMKEYRQKTINCKGARVKVIKTKEQKAEDARIRKQKSRQGMKEKYGDENWRKIHSKEIHLNRLKANNADESVIKNIKTEIEMLKNNQ